MKNKQPKRVLLASSWWNEDLIRGVSHNAAKLGWHLDLQMCLTGHLPEEWSGDGIIVLLGSERLEMPGFLERAKCPAVAISLNEPQMNLPRVAVDSIAIGKKAAQHFLERSFRSFAFYAHSWQSVDILRHSGFQKMLENKGYDCTLLSWKKSCPKRKDTWLNRQRWLRRKLLDMKKPLAVFSTDDTTAVEVIEACIAEGIQIPEQASILGSGNIEVFRESTTVPLSSIVVDFDRISEEAVNLLNRLMQGHPNPKKPLLIPPSGLAVRRSSDTIAAQTPEVVKAIRFMYQNYPHSIGLNDIIKASGTSKTRLYQLFDEQIGHSPVSVLVRIRINKAKHMLCETDEKIHAIATECGFGDPVNLYRCFKRYEDISPSECRKLRLT